MYNKCALFPRSIFHLILLLSLFVLCLFDSASCEFYRSARPDSWPDYRVNSMAWNFDFLCSFFCHRYHFDIAVTVVVIDVVLRLCSSAIYRKPLTAKKASYANDACEKNIIKSNQIKYRANNTFFFLSLFPFLLAILFVQSCRLRVAWGT